MTSETAAPLSQEARARTRHDRLVGLQARIDLLQLQVRQETAALVDQDTPFGHAAFVPDELSMSLGESAGTCRRRVEDAQVTVAHPRLVALVEASATAALVAGEAVVTHAFGVRHLDAVLDELAGASDRVQEQVLDLVLADASVRTPAQHRKAVRAARLLLDLDGAEDVQDRLHDDRSVSLHDERDGSASLLVNGLKSMGAEMIAALDAQPGVGVPVPGETRTLAARRYDHLYGLLCGREQATAPWQALVVVSLATLEGGDVPAEIPGLGLVSAEEARELLAKADLRRAVVDDAGHLVSLDDQVLAGDQEPLGPAPVELRSETVEPAPVSDEAPGASEDDRAWWAALQDDPSEREVERLVETGLAAIEQHVKAQLLVLCGPHGFDGPWPDGGGAPPDRPGPVRPGGDGQGMPATGPPTDDLDPSPGDRIWLAQQEEAAGVHDLLNPGWAAPARTAPSLLALRRAEERLERQARSARWTETGLRDAVTVLRTARPCPVPGESSGYLFRGRLRRWVQARDVTCTFPGCHLLAQRCEVDHVVEHPVGPTSACNAACECVHHHQCKHAVMTVTRLADGTVRWTNRFALALDRPPRPLLRGW